MRQTDLSKYMDELETCHKLNFKTAKEFNITPNEMCFLPMKPILVVKRSDNGEDFAVSQGGVKYCIAEEDRVPGVQSYILLVDRDRSYVAQTTAREFLRRMNGINPRASDDQRFGAYWWVDDNFNFAGTLSRNPTVDRPPWIT